MRFVRLGNTSLRVTDLALGTGALASRVDEKTSLAIMDCYIGEGGNFIDTANVYGRWNPGNLPLSEMMIGKWLSFHHLRDKVVLATKGAADNEGEKGKKRLSREEIRHDLHDSLKNLKTDYIDLYYLHQDDPTREVGEIMETMNELKREGLVRYFASVSYTHLPEPLPQPFPLHNGCGYSHHSGISVQQRSSKQDLPRLPAGQYLLSRKRRF